MRVSPGSKLGPYEIVSFVGAGGMGEVYRARDTRPGREVAIKILRADRRAAEAGRRRFAQEARTASSLNHPNIATIHDIATADGSQVVFAWDGERPSDKVRPDFDLWLKLVGGSEARPLTTGPEDDVGPCWSLDGRQIAFLRGRLGGSSHIYFVSPLGGSVRKLGDFPAAGSETTWFRGAAVPQLSWSPDGRWIVAARARAAGETAAEAGGIHLLPIGGGDSRPITKPAPPALDRDPA